jgi:cytochrome c-type biogenesis protein CcsB
MKFSPFVIALLLILTGNLRAADFESQIDLKPLQTVAVQHNQTMKTLDTFARQAVSLITGHSTIDGHSALFTLLDMSFKPETYSNRNIIKIRNVPLREEFQLLDFIDDNEKKRIIHDGTVSLVFLARQDVQVVLENAQAASVSKNKAIGDLMSAMAAMKEICELDRPFLAAAIVPPATNSPADHIWHRPVELLGNDPKAVEIFKKNGHDAPAPLEKYQDRADLITRALASNVALLDAWTNNDPAATNKAAQDLADVLPKINPAVYPAHAKLRAEVVYNHLMKLTIPGASFYFIAMVLFIMSARSGVTSLRLWALRLMAVGFLIHTLGIGIRWWLVGDIFPPIKNEFESVMFSAWFGALVGMILEIRRSRGIFGAAASFVGTLSLVAIFAAPYVTGREIGGEIGQVQGILMSYWLYIHVTMVTAAYSLIGMGFMLSSWWLFRYYKDYGTLRRVPGYARGFDVSPTSAYHRQDDDLPVSAPGGAISLGFTNTLARVLFLARPQTKTLVIEREPSAFLAMLDQCNLVVLQLAFWVLGAGIVCGAIWADQSWGRPWGWDPKETFALVTWIVYLIVVHVRIATANDRAWWTAVLSCIGFFVMLFNWIGVNFLLVGLHSYA